METGELGRVYQDGEVIIGEGQPGDRMYVIQSGRVAVTRRVRDKDILITELGKEDIFGEMALFDRSPRSATVRAIGRVRALSVDKRTLLYRVHDDPSLAYRILQQMSRRIRAIDRELAELKEMANQGGALRASPAALPRPLPPAAGILKFFTQGLAGWKRTAATRGKIEAAGGQRRRGDRRKLERRQAERRRSARGA